LGNIGWIGLGLIGLPMAARLAAAGWRVQGFDVKADRLELAATRGITAASSAAEAVDGAQFVFTSLPTETALVQVFAKLKVPLDSIVVETSTVGPKVSARVAKALAPRRVPYLRAPISGSTNLAESGTLTTFVSGPKEAFDRAREALSAYSRSQLWLGEAEEARYAKLAVNLMVAVTAGMMGEALALARKGGIGWDAVLGLVGESVVASPLVKYKLEPLRRRDFTPAATSALVLKDLELLVKAARESGVKAPLARHMLAVYRAVKGSELEGEDFFSVVKVTERESGL
jgi:3-hydroxyisobutyrate dehydrogenase-like beta-hydroxyacid dehydrogenase